MINKHEVIFRIAAFTRCTLLPTSRSFFSPLSFLFFNSDENFFFSCLFEYRKASERNNKKKKTYKSEHVKIFLEVMNETRENKNSALITFPDEWFMTQTIFL